MDAFLSETVDLLERTPNMVRALLGGLPDSWGGTADVEGGWRPRDVVGHLVTAELDNWIPRVKRILDDGTSKPFAPFNRFAHEGRDDAMSLDQLIDRFGALRAQNLRQLADIVTEADLDRRGIHPVLGEVTLRQLLSTWTVHDLDHIPQIYP